MDAVTSSYWVFFAVVFASVFGVGLTVARFLAPDPTRVRLRQLALDGTPVAAGNPEPAHWVDHVVRLTGPLARLSVPDDGWENSPLRIRFMNAGWRRRTAPVLYFAAKTVLAVALPILTLAVIGATGANVPAMMTMGILVLAGAFGYYFPNGVLAHVVEHRQRVIVESFPDALDLLTVCVEAGLGLDAGLLRVASEMESTSKVLSEELHLVNLELRAGASKEKALRNLALRTGVDDVDTLVALLVQAERFGTSVADSLRVHSDSLRTKRRQRAEEAAQKIPVKLLFPLVFCIFPSMMLVLLGPAFIRIVRVFIPLAKSLN